MTALDDPMRLLAGDNAMRRAMALAVVFAVCWAVLEIVLGAALRAPYSLLQIVWCRYATHLCLVWLVWGWRRPMALWKTSRPASHAFRSVLMIIMPGAFTFAVHRGVSAEFVWSVFWIAPALIIAIAGLFLRERPPLFIALASVGGAVAAAAIFGHLWPPSMKALGLALAVASSFSIYVVMTRSLRDEHVEANMFYTALGPFLALMPAMPGVWIWPNPHDAVVLVSIGIVGFVALLALDGACRAAPVWGSAGAFFTQAFCVAVILAAISGVGPSLRVILGMTGIFVISGILWVRADRFSLRMGAEPRSDGKPREQRDHVPVLHAR